METLNPINNADAEVLVEADLFADELEDHFNNSAAGASTFSSLSTAATVCTLGSYCTLANEIA